MTQSLAGLDPRHRHFVKMDLQDEPRLDWNDHVTSHTHAGNFSDIPYLQGLSNDVLDLLDMLLVAKRANDGEEVEFPAHSTLLFIASKTLSGMVECAAPPGSPWRYRVKLDTSPWIVGELLMFIYSRVSSSQCNPFKHIDPLLDEQLAAVAKFLGMTAVSQRMDNVLSKNAEKLLFLEDKEANKKYQGGDMHPVHWARITDESDMPKFRKKCITFLRENFDRLTRDDYLQLSKVLMYELALDMQANPPTKFLRCGDCGSFDIQKARA